ncbi:MAG: ATP-dependent Clp protease adaptor ClpS [Marinilabiliales bacterium]|nr:ATP-dependent Clp protease adaptor ClpS [Marinilabiliales bacterium]
MRTQTKKGVNEKDQESGGTDKNCSLVLHNDDYHTFDYVIDALMEVCGLERMQAIQCTYLVHFKEKCVVKKGSKEELMPMRRGLSARDLKAVVH